MALQISPKKAKKLSDSSEPALKSLHLKKIINPYQRYVTYLDVEKRKQAKFKTMNARTLGFDKKDANDDNLTMQRLAWTLKAANQPEKLEVIFREDHGLSDRGLGYIGEGIKRLTSLRDLKLQFSECGSMTDEGMKVIAKALKNLTSLQKLTLKFQTSKATSAFSDKGMRYLTRALQKPGSLKSLHLDLSAMKITDLGMRYLSQSLKAFGSLKTLHIHLRKHSQITDKGIKTFEQSLKTLKDLEDVDLDFKNVSGEGFLSLSECFTKYTSLKHLGLCFERSHITDEAMQLFAQNLKKIHPLQSIHFGFPECQRITTIGVIYLREGLEEQKSLTSINLNFMDCPHITNTSMETIVDIFKNPHSLQHLILNFSRNNINHVGIKFLYKGIEGLASSLQSLHLGFLNMKLSYEFFEDPEDVGCYSYYDVVKSLSQVLPKLTILKSISLNVSGCDDAYMYMMSYLEEPLASLKSLQNISFDFSNIEMLLDNEELNFVSLLKKVSSIQSLNISFANALLSEEFIEEMFEYFTKFTSLQSIALDFTNADRISEVTQDELRQVLLKLPQLRQCSLKF